MTTTIRPLARSETSRRIQLLDGELRQLRKRVQIAWRDWRRLRDTNAPAAALAQRRYNTLKTRERDIERVIVRLIAGSKLKLNAEITNDNEASA